MVEHSVQLVDGVWPKRVAHLGTVERHPHRRIGDVAVVGDVGQIAEPVDRLPGVGVKRIVAQCY